MDPKPLIERWYDAWIRSDKDAARACVADDLIFRSPEHQFASADAFLDCCFSLSEGFDSMAIKHALHGPEGAYIVYAPGGGDFVVGELVLCRNGTIQEIHVTYNPTH